MSAEALLLWERGKRSTNIVSFRFFRFIRANEICLSLDSNAGRKLRANLMSSVIVSSASCALCVAYVQCESLRFDQREIQSYSAVYLTRHIYRREMPLHAPREGSCGFHLAFDTLFLSS